MDEQSKSAVPTDGEKNPRLSRHVRWSSHAFWLCLLLLVYILSIGPVAWIERNGMPSSFYRTFYKPLAVLCAHSAVANEFFGWYIGHLWGLARQSD